MRNAEASREKILEAATAEFAAYGIAGARVDRIAQLADCSKNLIYIYFTDKETLFATVLRRHLSRVYEDNLFTPDDLAGYAGRTFDYAMAHPDVMRLMGWFALERSADGLVDRAVSMREKLATLAEAQRSGQVGEAFPPAFVITAIMTLATAWSAVSPFGPALDPEGTGDPAGLRASIMRAVQLIAES